MNDQENLFSAEGVVFRKDFTLSLKNWRYFSTGACYSTNYSQDVLKKIVKKKFVFENGQKVGIFSFTDLAMFRKELIKFADKVLYNQDHKANYPINVCIPTQCDNQNGSKEIIYFHLKHLSLGECLVGDIPEDARMLFISKVISVRTLLAKD